MIKLPEGIGFTAAELRKWPHVPGVEDNYECIAQYVNAKLPALLPALLTAAIKAIIVSNPTPETEKILSIMRPLFEVWVSSLCSEERRVHGRMAYGYFVPCNHQYGACEAATHQAYLILPESIYKLKGPIKMGDEK